MELLIFLILFPALAGLLVLLLPKDFLHGAVVKCSALIVAIVSVVLFAAEWNKGIQIYSLASEPTGQLIFLIELLIAIFLLYIGIKNRQYLVIGLVIVQTALVIWLEMAHPVSEITKNLFVDELTLIMALIVGVIGGLIAIYATGYMREYHLQHKEARDRRPLFFCLILVFLSAMFGLIFSNNLVWIFFFWEVTTLCSFLLIGYSGTEDAKKNAFSALWMNLLGGLGFVIALIALTFIKGSSFELMTLITTGPAIALIPAVLIGFAGLTKSAQLPFSSWLLGAMVAPTPVSALLHSSTMVKAGVYIIVRFAPVFEHTYAGYAIALVGAVTFLIASMIAISQSNAKRVLAYSTVANLGLIIACAGIGTYEAMWAAIFLIIFHAIAKSLLFLCVGTAEHSLNSRDIEDMDGLVLKMPKVAGMILIGIAGMFLAPFGMLMSKYATMRAFLDTPGGFLLILILAFGSAVTVFFWSKWMGKIISVPPSSGETIEKRVSISEWAALYSLSALTIVVCFLIPVISSVIVERFLKTTYGMTTSLPFENVVIMILMLVLVLILPLTFLHYRKDKKHTGPYMCGRPVNDAYAFEGSLGIRRELVISNYYLDSWFGEAKLVPVGCAAGVVLILISFAAMLIGGVIL